MLRRLEDVLSPDEHARLLAIADAATFVDGQESADARLAGTKRNEQLARTDPAMAEIGRLVAAALHRCAAFRASAIPNRMHSLRLARYRAGDAYGAHVDAALMHDGRTASRADLSFTLFLSPPEAYDGGELRLELGDAEALVKLPARHVALYPTGALHAVRPITRGTRLVVVGWVQSFVRSADDRAVLFDLHQAIELVHAREGAGRTHDLLVRSHAELLRRWAEP